MWTEIVNRCFTPEQFARYCRDLYPTINAKGCWRPTFVVVHNTALPTMAKWHNVPGNVRMQNFAHYYRDIQKWHAGPHLFVSDDMIWAFTPLWFPGVHSPSWNKDSWGVETVGDFKTEVFGDPTRANVIATLAALHTLGRLDPDTLKFHKEDPKTNHDCPGKNMVKSDIIARVKNALSGAPSAP